MTETEFTVPGVEGTFRCDADELKSYRTIKQLAMAEKDVAGYFEAMGRIYMGNDEEYVERVGGFESCGALNDAAVEAARAKNSSPSSGSSTGTETKR